MTSLVFWDFEQNINEGKRFCIHYNKADFID